MVGDLTESCHVPLLPLTPSSDVVGELATGFEPHDISTLGETTFSENLQECRHTSRVILLTTIVGLGSRSNLHGDGCQNLVSFEGGEDGGYVIEMLTLEVHCELSQIVEIGLGTSLTEGPTFTFHADLNDKYVCFNNKN